MRVSGCIFLLAFLNWSCSDAGHNTQDILHNPISLDSCFKTIYIDLKSKASEDFVNFLHQAKAAGFKPQDRDTALYPFTKVWYKPPSTGFIKDTLGINDCDVFDSINIHYVDFISTHPSIDKNLPDINVRELRLKNQYAADIYGKALKRILKINGVVTKPTVFYSQDNTFYGFQVTDKSFIGEMDQLISLLNPSVKFLAKNY